eukprot:PLAT3687.2.p1 GENE.PLAT3687.2~~PLAT3687.2.p1  ORF type:complete len:788 (-),score=260.05 PLAT3687.2:57-2420(-)
MAQPYALEGPEAVESALRRLQDAFHLPTCVSLLNWVKSKLQVDVMEPAREDELVLAVFTQLASLSHAELAQLTAFPLRQLASDAFLDAGRTTAQYTTYFRLDAALCCSGFAPASRPPLAMNSEDIAGEIRAAADKSKGCVKQLAVLLNEMRMAAQLSMEADDGGSFLDMSKVVTALATAIGRGTPALLDSVLELLLEVDDIDAPYDLECAIEKHVAPRLRSPGDGSAAFSRDFRALCLVDSADVASERTKRLLERVACELMRKDDLPPSSLLDLAHFLTWPLAHDKEVAIDILNRLLTAVAGSSEPNGLVDKIAQLIDKALLSMVLTKRLTERDATAVEQATVIAQQLAAVRWTEGAALTDSHAKRRFLSTRVSITSHLLTACSVGEPFLRLLTQLVTDMLSFACEPAAHSTAASRAVVREVLVLLIDAPTELPLRYIDACLLLIAAAVPRDARSWRLTHTAVSLLYKLTRDNEHNFQAVAAYRPTVGSFSALFHLLSMGDARGWFWPADDIYHILTIVRPAAGELQVSHFAALLNRVTNREQLCAPAATCLPCYAILAMDACMPLPAAELAKQCSRLKLVIAQLWKAGDVHYAAGAVALTYSMLLHRSGSLLTTGREVKLLLDGISACGPLLRRYRIAALLQTLQASCERSAAVLQAVMQQRCLSILISKFGVDYPDRSLDAFLTYLFSKNAALPARIKSWPIRASLNSLKFFAACPRASWQLASWAKVAKFFLLCLAVFVAFGLYIRALRSWLAPAPADPWESECGLVADSAVCQLLPWLVAQGV